jgi:hypothetical protein
MLKVMAKAWDAAEQIDMTTGEMSNPVESARAAAEAIGLREMMEALEPFAKRGAYLDEHCPNAPDNDETGVDLGELRRAARALS